MQGRGSVLFFAAFIVMIACLAMAFLVETPAMPQADMPMHTAAQPALLLRDDSTAQIVSPQRGQALFAWMRAAALPKLPTPPEMAERDQNGVPLTHSAYIRAAYVKFPPEGTRG